MLINDIHLAELKSPNQTIRARVELYNGSTLEKICNCSDILSEFTVERAGEGKFFGYGVCQKLKASIIDIDREINLTKQHTIEASFGVDSNFIYPFPIFYVDTVERDETTNLIELEAYDALYIATLHTVNELSLPMAYTIKDFAITCGNLLGLPVTIDDAAAESFELYFSAGANFDGTENIREALNRIAEATQTIYYIDSNWELTFKRLDRDGEALLTIGKNDYVTLTNDGAQTLGSLIHVTELGDNVSPSAPMDGATQFIRENPFWELREDIAELVDGAQTVIGGLTITQFNAEWVGNYLLELGDKISIISENNEELITYVLNDTIYFTGVLSQSTQWSYDDNSAETESNPATLGEAINKTFARVDKANKQIELVAGEAKANANNISALQINTNSVSAYVSSVEQLTEEAIKELNEEFSQLSKNVSLKLDSESVKIAIQQELSNGTDKIKTATTGYTFDDKGLNITNSDTAISTTITEDGMKIYNKDRVMLVADNQGIKAEDLHASTYLTIGERSSFENYETNRTGCFWIGG